MVPEIYKWFNKKFPQNFILNKPYIGALIFLVFGYVFLTLYKPLNIHAARSLSLELTMVAYCSIFSIIIVGSVKLIKHITFFSNDNEWTILKEILSILIILTGMGIAAYFAGFLIEEPAQRWNLSTFLDSCKITFLIGIIPFAFFTLINYRYIFYTDIVVYYKQANNQFIAEQPEELIRIGSQLKKEELSFYPSQFLYAESDGNYVVFYLTKNDLIKKEIIRNSINNIEQQLSGIPYFIRIHRAFIVNLKKVTSKQGNTLGYRIKLTDNEFKIPVSRQNTKVFNELLAQYHI
jgi:hypothetical protein